MVVKTIRAPFGPADIILDKGLPTEYRFDGKENLQFEGGEVTLEPQYADIGSIDLGGGNYDQYVTHFEGTVVISGFEDSLENFALALGGLQEITDAENGVIGYSDAPIGASNRERSRTVTISPRYLMGDTGAEHIHIYKAASNASYTRAYGLEQGQVAIEMAIYPKDGADPAQGDNFFRRGSIEAMPTNDPVDPGV